jgi:hypothetical protein
MQVRHRVIEGSSEGESARLADEVLARFARLLSPG